MTTKQEKNQVAFASLREELRRRYPPEHYIAFDDGHVVADAGSFDALTDALAAIGRDSPDVFVVQVGVEYPDRVFILL